MKTQRAAWIWVPMPEKKYLGLASVDADGWFRIEMVDPIPNRLDDECYGESSGAKTIKQGVARFVRGMLADRKKYFGDMNWRPSRRTLRKLWKGRAERRKDIMRMRRETE